jgi:DNA-binding response OmpR family regulator
MPHVLIVDDEPDIRALLRLLLDGEGYSVGEAPDGKVALRAFTEEPPDLVVLDVTLPELDGWQTLERIRDVSDVPVMMLTARASEADRVRGLRSGADDYLVKPFGKRELLARVEALLRRAGNQRGTTSSYADGALTVDFTQRIVMVDGREVSVTPQEFRLLAALVRSAGRVLSHDDLLRQAWGSKVGVMPEQVKLYVGYLRRKLGWPPSGSPIETVRGVGYRYRPVDPSDSAEGSSV